MQMYKNKHHLLKNSSTVRIKGHSLDVLGFPGGSKVNIVLGNISLFNTSQLIFP